MKGLGESKSSHLFPGVSDVSSPCTADRGPSQVGWCKGIVTTNQGPDSGPTDQWGTRSKDTYLMPPPPTPHRDLTGGKGEEGVGGGTYWLTQGEAVAGKISRTVEGTFLLSLLPLRARAIDSEKSLAG